jgi:hypothetical protein
MKELLIIPFITVPIYLLYMYFKYGMTISISATYKHAKGLERLWFSATLVSIELPIMIVGIEAVQNDVSEVLFFIAGSLLCLVAASPAYWSNKMELTAHLIGSYGTISFGIIACIVYLFNPVTILLTGIYALFVISQFFINKLKLPNFKYWLEIGAIIVVPLILYLTK